MTRLPAFLLRCLLWACLFVISGPAEGSFPKTTPLVESLTLQHGGTTPLSTAKAYDLLNRLTATTATPSGAGALAHAYEYNAANQRVRVTHADGSYWQYQYDARGQVTSARRYWAGDVPVAGQQLEYGFDDIGNRTQAASGGDEAGTGLRTNSYTVNALNQYTSRTVPGYVNLLGTAASNATVTVNGQGVTRQGDYFRKELAFDNSAGALFPGVTNLAVLAGAGADGSDLVSTQRGRVFLPATPEAYAHDADGNLLSDGRWNYTWDGENRLVAAQSRGLEPVTVGAVTYLTLRRVEFTYDAQGRRRAKTSARQWDGSWVVERRREFAYDGWNLVVELEGAERSLVRSYLWGLDVSGSPQGAGGVGGLLGLVVWTAGTNNLPVSWHLAVADGNGNVTALVDAATGTVSGRYEYGAFGEPLRASGPAAGLNPFRFSTKYQDEETGFLYYGYRYYNALTGRWLSRDPLEEEGGLNLYGFNKNDAIRFTDYLGEWPQLFQDPETGAFAFADTYNVYYLGKFRAVSCRQVVPNNSLSLGAPFEHAKIEALGGQSFAMVLGSQAASNLGRGVRGLPELAAMVGVGAQGIGGGVILIFSPEPATKALGGALLLDALDSGQSMVRQTETFFEQGLGALGVGEQGKKIACCAKAVAFTVVALKVSTAKASGKNPARIVGEGVPDPSGATFRMGRFEPKTGQTVFDDLGHFGQDVKGLNLFEKEGKVFWSNDSISSPKMLTADEVRAVEAALRKAFPNATIEQVKKIGDAVGK